MTLAKAIVAMIMGAVFVAKDVWGADIGIDEGGANVLANALIWGLGAFGVYQTKNAE